MEERIEEYDVNAIEIRNYLRNRRSKAFSYLMTIGAKALVVSKEQVRQSVLITGMDCESKEKRQIHLNEVCRMQQSKLRDGVGIEVWKRGRNGGKPRKIQMKIKVMNFQGEQNNVNIEYLSWKGQFLGIKNKFSLETLVGVELLYKNKNDKMKYNEITTSVTSTSVPPYVHLINEDRAMDLLFYTLDEAEAFVFYCQQLIEKKKQVR